ncbi:MAG: DUF1206 domain-containing protein, partial [Candidatus Nanopelagicales bacterium]
MSEPVDTMTDVAADIGDSEPLGWAARVGLVARAVVYLLIGALGLSLLAGNPAELDQRGARAERLERPFGRGLGLLGGIGFGGAALG